jgi:hypothetical protein
MQQALETAARAKQNASQKKPASKRGGETEGNSKCGRREKTKANGH